MDKKYLETLGITTKGEKVGLTILIYYHQTNMMLFRELNHTDLQVHSAFRAKFIAIEKTALEKADEDFNSAPTENF